MSTQHPLKEKRVAARNTQHIPLRVLLAVVLALSTGLSIVGCSPTASISTATEQDITQQYTLPGNYQKHRQQQRYFESSAGTLAYTDHGSGDVIVLLHGVPTSSWMYRKLIDKLQDTKRVVSIDFLGYGSSDKPKATSSNYSHQSQSAYVQELLKFLNIEQYALLFHDMGSLPAWHLIQQDIANNQFITELFILNSIINKDGFNHPNYKKGLLAKQMSKAYSSKLSSAAVLNMTFNNMGLSANITLSENECAGYVIPLREGSDEALYQFFTGFTPELFENLDSYIGALENFTGQATILWGGQDKVLTTQQLPILEKALNISGDNVHIFTQNSHFLAEEIPELLAEHIKK